MDREDVLVPRMPGLLSKPAESDSIMDFLVSSFSGVACVTQIRDD